MMRRRSTNRRGSVYILVLASALIVVVAGLSGLAAARLRHRTTSLEQTWNGAAHLAQSAIDHALISVENDPWWRQTYEDQEDEYGPEIPIGNGTMSWRLDDLNDSNLDNDNSDPVRIYGRGTIGSSAQAYSVIAWPSGQALDVLRCALHAAGTVNVDGVLDVRIGPVSSNNGVSVNNAQIIGDVETPAIDAPANVTGSVTVPSPDKTMPSAAIWDTYKAMSTEIRLADVGSTTIQSTLIGPGVNPYRPDERNPDGVYRIKVPSLTHVKLKNCRVVGTLLVELQGDGSSFTVDDGVMMSPASSEYPTLLVYTDRDVANNVTIKCTGTLDELGTGVNFNPEIAPYFGSFDTDIADVYSASLRGLIHVIRDRSFPPTSTTTIEAGQQIFGCIIADGKVDTEGATILVADPRLRSRPPLGYSRERESVSLLVNGGAENGLTGWVAVGGDVELSTVGDRHSGSSSLDVDHRDTPAHGVAQDITSGLTSGVPLTSDCWIKLDDDPEAVRIRLIVDSTGDGIQQFTAVVPNIQDQWTRVVAQLTPSWTGELQGAAWLVSTTTTEQDFRIDDALLIPHTTDVAPRLQPIPGTWRAEAAQ